MTARVGTAEWKGDLKTGSGTLRVGEGVFEGDYSFVSRFEDGAGTNPEELIAAAHAGCFSMSLGNILAGHGHTPDFVRTTAQVSLRNIDGKSTIATIELATEGSVPGIDEEHFRAHAEEAKDGCPVSRALAGVPEIVVTARLVD
ncbi:MAG: OsmC family protein [Solirubrobacterales bacterium]